MHQLTGRGVESQERNKQITRKMQLLTVAFLLLSSITDPTESVQDQLKSRIRRVYFSKKSVPLINEKDTYDEKYGCVVDQCFSRLKTCTNTRIGIPVQEEKQILEVRCVIEFGTCANACFNDYKISNSV